MEAKENRTDLIQFRIFISLLGFAHTHFSYFIKLSELNADGVINDAQQNVLLTFIPFYTLLLCSFRLSSSLSLWLFYSHWHICAKTITIATHKFIKCQRKADRRKNNDIMRIRTMYVVFTHTHTRTHTYTFMQMMRQIV